ncbi:hypothetical protein [Flavobacterium sp. SM2513]|uniref:hypothetical protein n=1 Tax=Flavobacterium sp. SM2513 TaxID=3424766 RepID=UPI003D7F6F54
MLKRHYVQKKTPLVLIANYLKETQKHAGKKVGLLPFSTVNQISEDISYRFLSENDSLREAVANLYFTLTGIGCNEF